MNSALGFSDLFREVLNRLIVLSASQYELDGKLYDIADGTSGKSKVSLETKAVKDVRHNALVDHLAKTLFHHFFSRRTSFKEQPLPPRHEHEAFVHQLSKANLSTTSPDSNWRIIEINEKGITYAEKEGVRRPLLAGTYEMPFPGQLPVVGQKVNFYRIREHLNLASSEYQAFSNVYMQQHESFRQYYFHISAEGVPLLLGYVTSRFNDFNVPFRFQCFNHPSLYPRANAAVLHVMQRYTEVASQLIRNFIDALRPFLIDEIPLLTHRLEKGVGFLEVPQFNPNIGQELMQELAATLIDPDVLGCHDSEDRLKLLCQKMDGFEGLNRFNS